MGMRGVILSFTEEIVKLVWEKGKLIPGFDENVYRKDDFGTWIFHIAYNNRSSTFGWEIDRIDSNGGDEIDNLRPIQWQNLLKKNKVK